MLKYILEIPHSTQLIFKKNVKYFCKYMFAVSLNAFLKWQWTTGSAISAAVMTQRSLRSASHASAVARSVVLE